MTPKKAAIIIINWNGKSLLERLIVSLSAISFDHYQLIVVDNASSDGSVEFLRNRFPEVRVIETGSNIGYGAACNLGTLDALDHGADYLYFSNNDILFDRDFLKNLVQRMEEEPDLGILGAAVYHMDRKDEIQSLGLTFGPFSLIHNVAIVHDDPAPPTLPVDSVMGGAFLMTKEAFIATGGFDPHYFMYFEEVDLCHRAREKGFRVATDLNAVVWHQVYGSFDGDESPLSVFYRFRNHLIFLKKNRSRIDYLTYGVVGFCYVIPRKVMVSIKQRKSHLILPCIKGWINGLTAMVSKTK